MHVPGTLFDKLWRGHEVAELAPGVSLLHVDRHYIHDLQSSAFDMLAARGLAVRNPELTVCVADHGISTLPGRSGLELPATARHLVRMREGAREHRISMVDANHRAQGIIHVIGPQLGLTQPGMLVACGDSHTGTHGALGALALGIGTTEIVHVLATQTVCVRRPRTLRITLRGAPAAGVEAKDLILALIARLGTAAAAGSAIEYAGPAVRDMDMDARMTLCNLSIELGANFGLIAPDDITTAYVLATPHAPAGPAREAALAHWRDLRSDDDASFDREEHLDASTVKPQISWGTNPGQTVALDARLPDPANVGGGGEQSIVAALDYMGLRAGQPIAGTAVDHVFIGSCANGRLSDLRRAARVLRGRRVAAGTGAWVVPGSQAVRAAAEAEGLHVVFRDAGFEWRAPGCSMCVGVNGETLAPGQRCVSTSNRNFVGRQGPGVRTHLAGAGVAAAAAVLGRIPSAAQLRELIA